MKNTKQVLALAMAVAMAAGLLAGCGSSASSSAESVASGEATSEAAATDTGSSDGTLVLADTGFEGKFSPFFAASSADQHVIDLTNIALLGADRKGEMILKGIEGETRNYNGTDYTYTGIADIEVVQNEDGTVDYTKDFFEKPVNLTVSGQLEAEAMAMAFGKVYTFGPTFRAEKSFTTRHAAEFWMIEPEMAFCDLNGYMDTAEAMTKYVIRYVLDNCPDEMAFFNQFIDKGLIERLELVANSEFGRISYTDAIEILKKNNKKFQFPVEWGVDIQTEHERYLTEVVFKKPVFVTDYPKEIKSFYMKQNADGKTVAAADMLVPGIGELIGGSQREENYDKLVARMDELGMDKTNYEWYLNLRKFGGVEHAGYGLGFERMIMYLTGIQNIRDVLPFPRTTGSLEM